MVTGRLKVFLTQRSDAKTHFYGKQTRHYVVENFLDFEKDDREEVAPHGIHAVFNIDKSYVKPGNTVGKVVKASDLFDISVNSRYLNAEGENCYSCSFHVEKRVYMIDVWFEDDKISHLVLSEWLNNGDFENNAEADNKYRLGEPECVKAEILED